MGNIRGPKLRQRMNETFEDFQFRQTVSSVQSEYKNLTDTYLKHIPHYCITSCVRTVDLGFIQITRTSIRKLEAKLTTLGHAVTMDFDAVFDTMSKNSKKYLKAYPEITTDMYLENMETLKADYLDQKEDLVPVRRRLFNILRSPALKRFSRASRRRAGAN